MSELRDLYQQVILDHHRTPRNFRRLPHPTRAAEGENPLCGDRVSVEVEVAGGVIRDVAFQGSGCAISRASASMMTLRVKGRSTDQAAHLADAIHRLLTGGPESPAAATDLGDLQLLQGVRHFPQRVKCASLAWRALEEALRLQAARLREGQATTEESGT